MTKSSTKQRAKAATLAATARLKKTGPKAAPRKPAKAASKKPAKAAPAKPADTAAIREHLGALQRRMRGKQVEAVAGELAAYLLATPGAGAIAGQLGLLHKAIDQGLSVLVDALTTAGVDPMTASKSIDHPHALAAAAGAYFETGPKPLIENMLAHGGDPDVLWPDPEAATQRKMRRRSPLDFAIDRAGPGFSSRTAVVTEVVELLTRASSPTTRVHALVSFLFREHVRFESWEAVFDHLLANADLSRVDHEGLHPLLVAAHRAHPVMFERIYEAAAVKDPVVEREIALPLHRGVPPPGGTVPMLRYPPGTSALAIARSVHAKLEQTLAESQQPSVHPQHRESSREKLPVEIEHAAAVIAFLEARGHAASAPTVRLEAPLEVVRAACAKLAAHLGIASFDARAALIDPVGLGAFGYFLACAKLIAAELDDARRTALQAHLLGRFITRTINRTMLLRDEEDDLADMGPDPTLFRVWPEDYPKQFRSLLEAATHYGLDGDAVICLEPRPGSITKLWAISPTTGVDHGPIDAWVAHSVQRIVEA